MLSLILAVILSVLAWVVYQCWLDFRKGLPLAIAFGLFLPPALAFADLPGLPLLSFSRVVNFVVILGFLGYLYRHQGLLKEARRFPLLPAFLILLALRLLALLNSTVFGESIKLYLSSVLEIFLPCLAIWTVLRAPADVNRLFRVLLGAFVIIGIYGLFCKVTGENLFIDAIMENKVSDRGSINTYDDSRERAGLTGRLQSFFQHPITYGGYLLMALPLFSLYLVHEPNKLRGLALLGLILINVLFTNSRSVYAGCGLFILGFFLLQNVRYFKYSLLFMVAGVIGGVVVVQGDSGYAVLIRSIFSNEGEEQEQVGGSSVEMRNEQFLTAANYFLSNPISGLGEGKVRLWMLSREESRDYDKNLLGAESFLFGVMIETGLLGLGGYAFFFGYILYALSHAKHMRGARYPMRNALYAAQVLVASYLAFIFVTGQLNTQFFFPVVITVLLRVYYSDLQRRVEAPSRQAPAVRL